MLHAVWRIVRIGALAALIVAFAGWALGRIRFGASDREAVARVEAELRDQFSASATALGRIATELAAGRPVVDPGARGPLEVRRLFDAVDAALVGEDLGRTGATIYDPLDTPIAWAGRTSDPARSRLDGPAGLFVVPEAFGPRLLRVEPVFDRSRSVPTQIATIVVEQQLGPGRSAPGSPETFVLSTTLGRVSMRVRNGSIPPPQGPYVFAIASPSGDPLVDAEVSAGDLAAARARWGDEVRAAWLSITGVTLLLCIGALMDVRRRSLTAAAVATTTMALVAVLVVTRVVGGMATSAVLEGHPLHGPVNLLLSALALLAAVWVALDTLERWRLAASRHRLRWSAGESMAWIGVAYAAAGIATAAIVWLYERLLRSVVADATFDLLQFSLHPLDAVRLTQVLGLVLLHAAVIWSAVVVTRMPSLRPTRPAWPHRVMAVVAWTGGIAVGLALAHAREAALSLSPLLWGFAVVGAGTVALTRLRRGARRRSQAARLGIVYLALLAPALAMYPSLLAFVTDAKEQLIATQYGPQVKRQRAELQTALYASLDQIDAMPSLAALAASPKIGVNATADRTLTADRTARAFRIWSNTDLNVYRLTSAVEIYGADGRLVSRFALNLPEYANTSHTAAGCEWDVVDETSPFGSSQRHVLRASRGICERGTPVGSIVVSVVLDYRTLPFIVSQSPYLESLQVQRQLAAEGAFGRDVEFAAYGWSRALTFTSGTSVWPLTDAVFQQLVDSRSAFWEAVERDGVEFRVFFTSDRGGIYALGYPVVTWAKHFVNLAELVFLVAVLYMVLLGGVTVVNAVASTGPANGRALLREIRASFYRKLFLTFVATAVVPVLILAVATRTYFATQFDAEVKEAAAKTATVAQRLVEDYAALEQRGTGGFAPLDDQIMVLVRRAIDQDVNLFERAQLNATSARDLFASGILPTRTPSDVYRHIVLDRLPTYVGEEEAILTANGDSSYLLAAAPVRAGERESIVTVPVTLRHQETERQIDELDHQVLAAAVLFSLLGAALGYWMAERVADPINRLTRATQRIARGNFDARVVAATSDELGQLIRDFNGMAEDLKRQRSELERTQRLEAWADMARQVAHDIKNPLTPIQLSAEHARRVNIDRGRPLSPVLDECIAAILSQVRLLRQIASEFSSFASTATAHPESVAVVELIEEVVGPYRMGLSGRIAIDVVASADLPKADVDRHLLARAIINIIENALHAMPGAGRLTLAVSRGTGAAVAAAGTQLPSRGTEPSSGESLVIDVTDTGVGMDHEALARIFEPYFSTKATGTGLGLTIARRNVELNGGTIAVRSERGVGTTVTISIPVSIDESTRPG